MNRNPAAILLGVGVALAGLAGATAPAGSAVADTPRPAVLDESRAPLHYVGVVSTYRPGRELQVSTGEKTRFLALGVANPQVFVDSNVEIGTRVSVVEWQSPDGQRVISVARAG